MVTAAAAVQNAFRREMSDIRKFFGGGGRPQSSGDLYAMK
jgi:hypothetical protein